MFCNTFCVPHTRKAQTISKHKDLGTEETRSLPSRIVICEAEKPKFLIFSFLKRSVIHAQP